MYPQVIILSIAIIRKDKNIACYILPMSFIGASIALYQYLLQMTPLFTSPASCGTFVSCSQIDKIYFGFITIPFLSLVAFAVISLLMLLILKDKDKI